MIRVTKGVLVVPEGHLLPGATVVLDPEEESRLVGLGVAEIVAPPETPSAVSSEEPSDPAERSSRRKRG